MIHFFLDDPDDPWKDFDQQRREAPVYFHEPLGQWFLFRHADVLHALANPDLSNDRMAAFEAAAPSEWRERLEPVFRLFDDWLFMKDGGEHQGLRKWMQASLSPDFLRSQAAAIEGCVGELLDPLGPAFDLSRDFGFILPLNVIAQVIGLPRDVWPRAMQWSVDITDFFNILPSNDDTCSRIVRSGREFYDYTAELVELRKEEPQEDLVTRFVQQGEGVDAQALIANTMVLTLAGHVAVRNLIGNTVWLLLTNPEELQRVREEPELVAWAVEESLRCEAPVSMVARVAARDCTVAGASVKKGQFVQLVLASANRDPEKFEDPDAFRVRRHPNPHLSFAPGIHTCLGAQLARQQTVAAVRQLLQRYPNLRLDDSKPIAWYRNAGNRGPESLPVRVD